MHGGGSQALALPTTRIELISPARKIAFSCQNAVGSCQPLWGTGLALNPTGCPRPGWTKGLICGGERWKKTGIGAASLPPSPLDRYGGSKMFG